MSDDEQEVLDGPRRPEAHKFQNQFVEQARNYCQLGATDADLARFFKVNRATIHAWRVSRPEFAEACRVGKEATDERVERSLLERACGYEYEAEKIFLPKDSALAVRVPYQEHVPADVTASKFWLMNRQPDKWRDRQQHEHTGKDGGPIETRELSPIERKRRVAAYLLKLADEPEDVGSG